MEVGRGSERTKTYNDLIDYELFHRMSSYSIGIEGMTVGYSLHVSWIVRKLSMQWRLASYITHTESAIPGPHERNTLTSHRKHPGWSREQPSMYRECYAQESLEDLLPSVRLFSASGVTCLLTTYPYQVGVLLPFYLYKRQDGVSWGWAQFSVNHIFLNKFLTPWGTERGVSRGDARQVSDELLPANHSATTACSWKPHTIWSAYGVVCIKTDKRTMTSTTLFSSNSGGTLMPCAIAARTCPRPMSEMCGGSMFCG